ncbi:MULTISPECIES: 3-oxoacyl-ACP reductase family protein [unclassified Chelatococcus]|uniref:SDR family NAD(P)-dependent oxidoreductase n=1 Tax=unclassified Chelatococcus TaxID=2638111 RepID=UPI001BD079AC|nr:MULTISPECIES: 3-oxoacyl-ACP reductase family protein [unclassified Chelatococcus]CAH1659571.1 3-oxoacyl-(acyl-carrier-protein) reductase FabG [Hyphomicrobiales bacterium]MBS7740963.1 3-oxoacyl-ACP reductase FabG [Chelatococcus sp. HY11]MBX3546746.1 3-oxoacyl-ACP reductase FabG [Chelatococcus sp.]MCO5077783.1 3-oxoacyl-ACP reductase FabG [Chelatococcus sp.]CAH1683768.1 3-oxoacyl-(acyl-carrier-protein) reductase FabG [Hyphomicrobiales bacterium]
MLAVPPASNNALKGKVALVTGAQRGIGRSVAVALASAGADIAINWLDNEADARLTGDLVEEEGRRARLVRADVAQLTEIAEMVQEAVSTLGSVDILVNNAGIFPRVSFLELSEEVWDAVVAVNLKAAAFCTQAVARELIRLGRTGCIVNMSSSALRGSPRGAHYSASKAGLIGLTRTTALELAPYGIRVNAVAPGLIDTAQPRGGYDEVQLTEMTKSIPLRRMGQAGEIADAVLFLASDASSFVTGELIHVNGGAYMG